MTDSAADFNPVLTLRASATTSAPFRMISRNWCAECRWLMQLRMHEDTMKVLAVGRRTWPYRSTQIRHAVY